MQILTIDKDKFVAVEGERATVYSRLKLAEEVKQAEARLQEIPETPSDEELLVWARENYPMVDYSREKQSLEQVVSENSKLLESIK